MTKKSTQISELWREENNTVSERGLLKSGILGHCFKSSLPDKWFKSKVSCIKSQRSQVHLLGLAWQKNAHNTLKSVHITTKTFYSNN